MGLSPWFLIGYWFVYFDDTANQNIRKPRVSMCFNTLIDSDSQGRIWNPWIKSKNFMTIPFVKFIHVLDERRIIKSKLFLKPFFNRVFKLKKLFDLSFIIYLHSLKIVDVVPNIAGILQIHPIIKSKINLKRKKWTKNRNYTLILAQDFSCSGNSISIIRTAFVELDSKIVNHLI